MFDSQRIRRIILKKRQPEMAFLNRLGLQDTPEFCGYSSYLHWYPHTSDAPKYCLPALSFWDQVSVSVPDIENRKPERLSSKTSKPILLGASLINIDQFGNKLQIIAALPDHF